MIYLIIVLVSLALSFFFSGSETAFLRVNKVRVEVWRRNKDRIAQRLIDLLQQPERFIYTTLIGNNIFNVTFATFATLYFLEFISPELTWLLVVTLTLLWGEIIPKTVFATLADWIVRKIAPLMTLFYHLFRPIIAIVAWISDGLLHILGVPKVEVQDLYSRKDVEALLSSTPLKFISDEPEEEEILTGIINLRELRVREALIPRMEIVAAPESIPIDELEQLFISSGYTKVPVFGDNIDHFIGVVFLKDLFQQPEDLQQIMRPVMMVPDSKRCSELLSEFRSSNNSIAIVINEYGGTAGLITTEDLIEVLFGDIEDEHDSQESWIRTDEDGNYRVNARIEIDRLNELLNVDLPEGDYETLAGLLIDQANHIPRRDESFRFEKVDIIITKATRRKVEWVKIIPIHKSIDLCLENSESD